MFILRKIRRSKHLSSVIIVAFVATFASGSVIALLFNIFERKQEAEHHHLNISSITDESEDPSIWGQNFPLQYESYLRTVDQVRTRYGGSEAIPRTPTLADPRSVVAQSRLEEDPRLKQIWAGYAFATDFREERGHAYMLIDQNFTERQKVSHQPGACLNCHASTYVPMMRLGESNLLEGFHKLNKMSYDEARKHVQHPVSCIDCHSPSTMKLRITRPAFVEGMRAYKATLGVKSYDVNRDATHQEMRSFVCGQCHVEYYFKGSERTLTYPWANGLQVENILDYYEQVGHKDWNHKDAGTPALKAQHPEFEIWSQGTHAKSGVACADCHMPYKRAGAVKFTDHHIRSPLLNIGPACQTCHGQSEEFLISRVNSIQEKNHQLRNIAMDAVVGLISDLKLASAAKLPSDRINRARHHHRRAQFMLDFIEAENSTGFHAPQEAARVLALSLEETRKGQLILRPDSPAR